MDPASEEQLLPLLYLAELIGTAGVEQSSAQMPELQSALAETVEVAEVQEAEQPEECDSAEVQQLEQSHQKLLALPTACEVTTAQFTEP